jgi:hypothetical protein
MKLQVIKIRVLSWIKRILLYGTYLFLILMVSGFILLQIPAVQTSIASRITSNFSKISGFEITYDQIYLIWYDRLEITGLLIKDPAENKMVEIEKVQVNFSLSTILLDKNINLDAASLNNGSVNLIKISDSDSTKDFNINLFIAEINKLSSGGGTGTPPKVNIGEIGIFNTIFTLHDPQKDSIPKAFDYNHITLKIDEADARNFNVIGDTIQFRLSTLIAEEQNCKLPVHNLSTYFRVSQTAM